MYKEKCFVYIKAKYLGCKLCQLSPMTLLGPIGPKFRRPLHLLEAHLVEYIMAGRATITEANTHFIRTMC